MTFGNSKEVQEEILRAASDAAPGVPVTLEFLHDHFHIKRGEKGETDLMDAIVFLLDGGFIEISGEGWIPVVRGIHNGK